MTGKIALEAPETVNHSFDSPSLGSTIVGFIYCRGGFVSGHILMGEDEEFSQRVLRYQATIIACLARFGLRQIVLRRAASTSVSFELYLQILGRTSNVLRSCVIRSIS